MAKLQKCMELHLVNTQVTDAGVQALSRCEHLQKIELRNTQVADTGVRSLAVRCNNLKHIDLNGTQVTVNAMQLMMQVRFDV